MLLLRDLQTSHIIAWKNCTVFHNLSRQSHNFAFPSSFCRTPTNEKWKGTSRHTLGIIYHQLQLPLIFPWNKTELIALKAFHDAKRSIAESIAVFCLLCIWDAVGRLVWLPFVRSGALLNDRRLELNYSQFNGSRFNWGELMASKIGFELHLSLMRIHSLSWLLIGWGFASLV